MSGEGSPRPPLSPRLPPTPTLPTADVDSPLLPSPPGPGGSSSSAPPHPSASHPNAHLMSSGGPGKSSASKQSLAGKTAAGSSNNNNNNNNNKNNPTSTSTSGIIRNNETIGGSPSLLPSSRSRDSSSSGSINVVGTSGSSSNTPGVSLIPTALLPSNWALPPLPTMPTLPVPRWRSLRKNSCALTFPLYMFLFGPAWAIVFTQSASFVDPDPFGKGLWEVVVVVSTGHITVRILLILKFLAAHRCFPPLPQVSNVQRNPAKSLLGRIAPVVLTVTLSWSLAIALRLTVLPPITFFPPDDCQNAIDLLGPEPALSPVAQDSSWFCVNSTTVSVPLPTPSSWIAMERGSVPGLRADAWTLPPPHFPPTYILDAERPEVTGEAVTTEWLWYTPSGVLLMATTGDEEGGTPIIKRNWLFKSWDPLDFIDAARWLRSIRVDLADRYTEAIDEGRWLASFLFLLHFTLVPLAVWTTFSARSQAARDRLIAFHEGELELAAAVGGTSTEQYAILLEAYSSDIAPHDPIRSKELAAAATKIFRARRSGSGGTPTGTPVGTPVLMRAHG